MSLTIIFGTMFSSKTSYLLGRLSSLKSHYKVIYVNHSFDDRSKCNVSTHNVLINIDDNDSLTFIGKRDNEINYIKTNKLNLEMLEKYDVIGIDEAQFFEESLINDVLYLVEQRHKHVYVAGLLITSERREFGYLNKLIPFADDIVQLKSYCSICRDTTPALFCIKRDKNNKSEISVGGSDKYQPVCRECYLKK